MKIKQWLITGALLAGGSMVVQGQSTSAWPLHSYNGGNTCNTQSYDGNSFRNLKFWTPEFRVAVQSIAGGSVPCEFVVNSEGILSKKDITGYENLSIGGNTLLGGSDDDPNGPYSVLGRNNLWNMRFRNYRLAVLGSQVNFVNADDGSNGSSYNILRLHNVKWDIKDTWHIAFSVNGSNQWGAGSTIWDMVQLKTRKTSSGAIFSIATISSPSNSSQIDDRFKIIENGNVGIGIDVPAEKLVVNGKVKATGFITDASSFPDYVFAPSYKLRSIDDLAGYIQEHQKLPGMPSEQEVTSKGMNLAEISVSTVEKVEELSLYIIQLNERIRQLELKLAAANK